MTKMKEDRVSVVLIGFSGAGKTSVAEELHRVAGWASVDIDAEIERQSRKKITDIVRVEGEDKFREQEHRVLLEVLEKGSSDGMQVVSVGGGAVLRAENQKILKERTMMIHLKVSEAVAARRVQADEESVEGGSVLRPLLSTGEGSVREQVSSLMKQREGLYDIASVQVWTDWAIASDVAQTVSQEQKLFQKRNDFSSSHITLPVRFGEGEMSFFSEVIVGAGVRESLGARIQGSFAEEERKIALVTDEIVQAHWGRDFQKLLEKEGFVVQTFQVLPGEESKNIGQAQEICECMLKEGFTRSDIVLGLGGGVIGDLAGLVASLYMRGVPLVHVPTTIVAQVDSAIGGKTGVNLEGGKNMVGTFYPGRIILSDIDVLSTLPEREFNEGVAEVIKYGLIASEDFFEWLELYADDILKRDTSCLVELVERSSKTKLDFVVGDIADLQGRRALLNFGHTVGHAIERLCGYGSFLHGEAISVGMVQALKLGVEHGATESGLVARTQHLLRRFKLPVVLPPELLEGSEAYRKLQLGEKLTSDEKKEAVGFSEKWVLALRADKKRVSQRINFVLVEKLGQARQEKFELSTLLDSIASR